MKIENEHIVCKRGNYIVVAAQYPEYTRDQALNLAAWLVLTADPLGEDFRDLMDTIQNQC